MRKYLIIIAVGVVLLSGIQLVQRQQSIADKLVRLHVVANSDTEADQRLKLQVRDAVLDQVQRLCSGCHSRQETVAVLSQQLPQLQATAQEALERVGCDDPVAVTLTRERFPTRYYATFTLPAGCYTALRIQLGEGAGRNWWCVAFPTLCTAAQQDLQAVAASCGFDEGEIAMITDYPQYQLDFKVLELLEKLQGLFAG